MEMFDILEYFARQSHACIKLILFTAVNDHQELAKAVLRHVGFCDLPVCRESDQTYHQHLPRARFHMHIYDITD